MKEIDFRVKIGINSIDWKEVCRLLEAAPLGQREPERLQKASEGSYAVCCAFSGEQLVGFVRALSDGVCQSAIYDLAVLPKYQRKGIGTAILEAILAHLPKGNVMLYTDEKSEAFYRKAGFWRLDHTFVKFNNP